MCCRAVVCDRVVTVAFVPFRSFCSVLSVVLCCAFRLWCCLFVGRRGPFGDRGGAGAGGLAEVDLGAAVGEDGGRTS